jgi:hypothetical protein
LEAFLEVAYLAPFQEVDVAYSSSLVEDVAYLQHLVRVQVVVDNSVLPFELPLF